MSPDDPRHGTRRGYYAHRRAGEPACDPCKRGAAAAEAARHVNGPSRTAPDGAARRIQALTALGWSYLAIQRATGIEDAKLRRIALGQRVYLHRATHAKIDRAYRRLSMTLPPRDTTAQRQGVSKALARAARNGWLPPLAWEDIDAGILAQVPDDERPTGRGMWHVHIAEDHAWLSSCGESDEQIARRLGVSVDGLQKALRTARKAS